MHMDILSLSAASCWVQHGAGCCSVRGPAALTSISVVLRPYVIVASVSAALGLPFVAVKALMFGRLLVSKWGVLLAASALFSLAHLAVALNVNLWARRRYQMGLLGQVGCAPVHRILAWGVRLAPVMLSMRGRYICQASGQCSWLCDC